MKKAALIFVSLAFAYFFLKEKQVADKWRKWEREEELARIAADNDPFWSEIKAEMVERKKHRELMEKANIIVHNYDESNEEF